MGSQYRVVHGSERERGTDEAEFVRDGGVAREVYAESSGFFALGEEDVALAEEDVPELVQLVERFQAQFRCRPAPAWGWTRSHQCLPCLVARMAVD